MIHKDKNFFTKFLIIFTTIINFYSNSSSNLINKNLFINNDISDINIQFEKAYLLNNSNDYYNKENTTLKQTFFFYYNSNYLNYRMLIKDTSYIYSNKNIDSYKKNYLIELYHKEKFIKSFREEDQLYLELNNLSINEADKITINISIKNSVDNKSTYVVFLKDNKNQKDKTYYTIFNYIPNFPIILSYYDNNEINNKIIYDELKIKIKNEYNNNYMFSLESKDNCYNGSYKVYDNENNEIHPITFFEGNFVFKKNSNENENLDIIEIIFKKDKFNKENSECLFGIYMSNPLDTNLVYDIIKLNKDDFPYKYYMKEYRNDNLDNNLKESYFAIDLSKYHKDKILSISNFTLYIKNYLDSNLIYDINYKLSEKDIQSITLSDYSFEFNDINDINYDNSIIKLNSDDLTNTDKRINFKSILIKYKLKLNNFLNNILTISIYDTNERSTVINDYYNALYNGIDYYTSNINNVCFELENIDNNMFTNSYLIIYINNNVSLLTLSYDDYPFIKLDKKDNENIKFFDLNDNVVKSNEDTSDKAYIIDRVNINQNKIINYRKINICLYVNNKLLKDEVFGNNYIHGKIFFYLTNNNFENINLYSYIENNTTKIKYNLNIKPKTSVFLLWKNINTQNNNSDNVSLTRNKDFVFEDKENILVYNVKEINNTMSLSSILHINNNDFNEITKLDFKLLEDNNKIENRDFIIIIKNTDSFIEYKNYFYSLQSLINNNKLIASNDSKIFEIENNNTITLNVNNSNNKYIKFELSLLNSNINNKIIAEIVENESISNDNKSIILSNEEQVLISNNKNIILLIKVEEFIEKTNLLILTSENIKDIEDKIINKSKNINDDYLKYKTKIQTVNYPLFLLFRINNNYKRSNCEEKISFNITKSNTKISEYIDSYQIYILKTYENNNKNENIVFLNKNIKSQLLENKDNRTKEVFYMFPDTSKFIDKDNMYYLAIKINLSNLDISENNNTHLNLLYVYNDVQIIPNINHKTTNKMNFLTSTKFNIEIKNNSYNNNKFYDKNSSSFVFTFYSYNINSNNNLGCYIVSDFIKKYSKIDNLFIFSKYNKNQDNDKLHLDAYISDKSYILYFSHNNLDKIIKSFFIDIYCQESTSLTFFVNKTQYKEYSKLTSNLLTKSNFDFNFKAKHVLVAGSGHYINININKININNSSNIDKDNKQNLLEFNYIYIITKRNCFDNNYKFDRRVIKDISQFDEIMYLDRNKSNGFEYKTGSLVTKNIMFHYSTDYTIVNVFAYNKFIGLVYSYNPYTVNQIPEETIGFVNSKSNYWLILLLTCGCLMLLGGIIYGIYYYCKKKKTDRLLE